MKLLLRPNVCRSWLVGISLWTVQAMALEGSTLPCPTLPDPRGPAEGPAPRRPAAPLPPPHRPRDRPAASRGSAGYGHPNTFGGLVFGLVLAYVLLRAQKVRWVDCLLVFAVGVFLLVGPASRSAAQCTLALPDRQV